MKDVPEKSTVPSAADIEWGWENAGYGAEWHEPIFDLMARYVSPSSVVLEVGAGGSHTLGAIAGRLKCDAIGVEPDTAGIRKAIDLAVDEHAEIMMIRGDGFSLPLANDAIDLVYSLGLIEHFDHAESVDLLREHIRVCKPSGRVIIAVPNFWNFPHTIRKWYLGKEYEFYPERSYRLSTVKRMMEGEGLSIECADGVAPLWGFAMASWAWRPLALMQLLGITGRLESLKSPRARAITGFMTYIIGRKS